MPAAGHAGDEHAEVRAIVESGFARLQTWLDTRLQRQEHLLQCIIHAGKNANHVGGDIGMAVEDGRCHPRNTDDGMLFEKPFNRRFDAPRQAVEDPLRLTATDVDDYVYEATIGGVALPSSAQPEGLADDVRAVSSGRVVSLAADACEGARGVPLPGSAESGDLTYDVRPPLAIAPTVVATVPDDTQDSEKLRDASGRLKQDWQSKLMDVFDQLDLDRSGSLDRSEFMMAFNEVGLPPSSAFGVFQNIDKTSNGCIDRIEWLHVIEEAARGNDGELDLIIEFTERLAARQGSMGRIYENDRARRPFLILRHDSGVRMVWDILMMILLFYISLTLPYSLGFGNSKVLDSIDRVFDILFCCDVVLNFRTTFADRDENIIVDGCAIARNYLKSWFLLDFSSSFPFDLITAGLMPNLTPARLLKIGKIAKVMKLLRISKMMKVFAGSELMETIEEKSTTKTHQTFLRVAKLLFGAVVLAHWLACFGTAVDGGFLDSYFDGKVNNPTKLQRYIAALYWAVTTLSTVGYGDLTPTSDAERLYAMAGMAIGAAFYGYIIGCVTSIVSDMDLNARAFYDRMDLIQSWLDNHEEIPKLLRKRLRRHFKHTLSTKAAIEDSAIVSELSPELRADTAFFIVHMLVRQNPMFCDLSHSALANIVGVIQKNHASANEFIVKEGDPGTAMYIMVEGVARYDKGDRWRPPEANVPAQRFQQLIEGDSFGEEILFGLEECYKYTIIATTDCELHQFTEDGFTDKFRNMPELRDQMMARFLKSRSRDDAAAPALPQPAEGQVADQKAGNGQSSALQTGSLQGGQQSTGRHGFGLKAGFAAGAAAGQAKR